MTTKINAISNTLADLFAKTGRADSVATKAFEKLINQLLVEEKQPTWFLAPSNELSTSSIEEFAACQLAYCQGMPVIKAKDVIVNTYAELFLLDVEGMKERAKELKAEMKAAKKDSVKRTLSREAEIIATTKNARNELLRKLSSMMRDNARKLITAYAVQAEHAALQMGKTRQEAKQARADKKAELDAASGFTAKKSQAKEPSDKKPSLEVIKQQAKNLANAIKAADESPLLPRELEQLNKLLDKIETCESH